MTDEVHVCWRCLPKVAKRALPKGSDLRVFMKADYAGSRCEECGRPSWFLLWGRTAA